MASMPGRLAIRCGVWLGARRGFRWGLGLIPFSSTELLFSVLLGWAQASTHAGQAMRS